MGETGAVRGVWGRRYRASGTFLLIRDALLAAGAVDRQRDNDQLVTDVLNADVTPN